MKKQEIGGTCSTHREDKYTIFVVKPDVMKLIVILGIREL
jgi:hypothetical protein